MAKYKIVFNKNYLKDLKKIPKRDQATIAEKILDLETNPRPINCKKLKGPSHPPAYRIRIGDYRVVYTIHDHVLLVLIVTIGHRKNIYQNIE